MWCVVFQWCDRWGRRVPDVLSFFFQQESRLNEEIRALEQEISRLENNPDKKIKAVVSIVSYDKHHQ